MGPSAGWCLLWALLYIPSNLLLIENFFWIPTGKAIGSRPCFLISSFGFFATLIWSAKATTLNSLVGARVLGAFLGAPTEAYAAAIVADLFFLHERGWWMGVYMFVQNTGSILGSIATGFLIVKGWRWHFWVLISLLAILM